MGNLLDRNRDILRRCGDLTPIAGPVRDVLWNGNKAVIEAGVSPGSTRRVPITWRQTHAESQWVSVGTGPGRRRFKMLGYNEAGKGPARAPRGAASRIVAGCAVSVLAGVGRLSFAKSWPDLGPIAEYLNDGTPRMPARPFFGYREIDLEKVRALMREHVIPRGVVGTVRGWFGG